MILGLTGKNASGKGEAANFLKNKDFVYFSLSDEIREEATNQGLDHSRDTLIKLGTNLREKYGVQYLASRVNKKIEKLKSEGKNNFIVDSIRNPGEIEELRKNSDFKLLGIDASSESRFQRILKRAREGDPVTIKEFKEVEERELSSNTSAQQLGKCLEMADEIVENNDTLDEFHEKLEKIIEKS